MRPTLPATLVALTIAVYFSFLAGRGLFADFTFDDLGNLYFAWIRPVPELLRANLLFFLPPTRSLGRLFYALGFQFVGLDPALYHLIVCFLVLCANIYLTFCFTLQLTSSHEIAALACLFHAYHGSAAALYYNSGTCYDVFCFFFYLSAFILYISIRRRGRFPRPSQIALLLCLYIAALNAKEMAVTLPVLIGCYELLYHPRDSWRSRGITFCAMGMITAAYILGTSRSEESLVKLSGYKPTFSASYLLQTGSFLNDLIYSADWFNDRRSLALLGAIFAIAWLSRSRELRFCWLFLTIGVLPIAFIPPRGLYAMYIPTVGLAIFWGIVLERAIRLIENQTTRVGLFVVAAVVLAAIHKNKGESNVAWITSEERQIRNVIMQLRRLHPEVPPGSRILFLRDPFEGRVWDSIFLLRLFYRDNSLVIERGPDGHDVQTYDYVWDFEQENLREVGRAL